MKRYLLALLFFFSVALPTIPAQAANSDPWNISGQGIYNAKDMVHIDSNYDIRTYNGDLIFGDNGFTPSTNNNQTTPSTTVGGYYGIEFPITNGSGISSAVGMVVVASTTASGVQGGFVSATATTTVLGVVDGTYATGTTMYYRTVGYATVLTTGSIKVGDLLVSSATAQGRAGAASGTVAVGTVIGKALTTGAAAGDTVLAILQLQ